MEQQIDLDPAAENAAGAATLARPEPQQTAPQRPQEAAENWELSTPPTARQTGRYVWQACATSLPLLAADLAAVLGAFAVAATAIGLLLPTFPTAFVLRQACAVLAVSVVVFPLLGLYPGSALNPIVEFRRGIIAITAVFGILMVANPILGQFRPFEIAVLGLAWALSLPMLTVLRDFARRVAAKFSWWGQPVLIVGEGESAARVYQTLQKQLTLGLRPIGIVGDLHAHWADNSPLSKIYLGPHEEIGAIARRHAAFWAVVTREYAARGYLNRVMTEIPNVVVLPQVQGLPSLWNQTYDFAGQPALQIRERLLLPVPRLMKRAVDVAAVVAGALALSPLLLLFCAMIKLSSPGPIFYKQRRIGRGGQVFWMWKFRSMVADADKVLHKHLAERPDLRAEWECNHKLRNDPRVTSIGKFLRRSSLDELPQIWNVLKGEMSLVGPRPIVDDDEGRPYIDDYPDVFHQYKKVLPGMTGLWQISGRCETSYSERIDLDSYYVRNWDPWLDLYILLRTVAIVVRGEGAY